MILIQPVALEDVLPVRREAMYPDALLHHVRLEDDAIGMHMGLYDQQQLVSVVSLFRENGNCRFRKFCTRPGMQGKGYGSGLLQYIIDWAAAEQYHTIWCNARVSAILFYQKHGMMVTGSPWKKGSIDYVKMEKKLRYGNHSRD